MKKNELAIVYGMHSILELIRAKKRKIYDIFIDKSRHKNLTDILRHLPNYTNIIYCDKKRLDNLCNSSDHQSIAAYVSPFTYQKNFFTPNIFPVILLCDSIQDTKNLGALLRSADCTNVLGVVITDNASTEITASVFKSSAGLAEYIHVHKSKNIKTMLEETKKNGYSIYLASANGIPLDSIEIEKPCAIVIGNEHSGINPLFYNFGTVLSLRQKETTISYNASVAGGIILYTIATKLKLI